MQKISTLFKKDPTDLGRVINEVDPTNEWALTEGLATIKFDGTACAIIAGKLYKRYDAKNGKPAPVGGIPCQEPDPITGHWPHWVAVSETNPADKWAIEAFRGTINPSVNFEDNTVYTYELCGPKIQGNPESLPKHYLVRHGSGVLTGFDRTFEGIKELLSDPDVDIEGIVFHHPDGRMCKIRKSDFGIKRGKAVPTTRHTWDNNIYQL